MPRKFFEDHVRVNYDEWRAAPLDERLAKNAVADLNNMAARAFQHWRNLDPTKLHGATNEGRYRNELIARECPDFALVRDVADAHKHMSLDRKPRRVTSSDQTAAGCIGWGEALGETLGGEPEIVITLDDGSKRSLRGVAENVLAMWDRMLTTWGL